MDKTWTVNLNQTDMSTVVLNGNYVSTIPIYLQGANHYKSFSVQITDFYVIRSSTARTLASSTDLVLFLNSGTIVSSDTFSSILTSGYNTVLCSCSNQSPYVSAKTPTQGIITNYINGEHTFWLTCEPIGTTINNTDYLFSVTLVITGHN